ncbi:MAG: HupE/UreJ family protein [Sphingomonadaceae bacterium]|nr:HupE/UreJ family protein [Sphingomonadaceae bacterium]
MIALIFTAPAHAHLTPNSEVSLDFGRETVTGDAIIPLGEFDYARGAKLKLDRAGQPAEDFRPYLAVRIGAETDGRPWKVALGPVRVGYDAGPPDLRFALTLTPPPGVNPRKLTLRWNPVIDSVANHFVLVLARSDFRGGLVSHDPQMLGGLQPASRTLSIDRGDASIWRGFGSAIGLGMHHIAEGHDHLLFLMTLLLPAPLLALGGRWGGYGGWRHTLRGLFRVVTAFTIGHSLTLIGGAAFGWRLPARPVECGIALSILISSIHAWRPLFPRREVFVAGGFGLIHGMAFATVIGAFGLEPLDKGVSILGFNLGIEIVQLLVVACTMPALVLLAPTRFYPPLRVAGAWLAGIAASAWLVERVFDVKFVLAEAIDAALGYAPWIVAMLTVFAVAVSLGDRRNRLRPQGR